MPPKRKSGGAAATRNAQSTLSFNSKKGSSARVTKPSSAATSKDLGKKLAALEDSKPTDRSDIQVIVPPQEEDEDFEVKAVDVEGVKAEVITLPKKVEDKTLRESEAENIPDTVIRRYWKKEEGNRLAPRVHQQDLTISEKILRHFDLSSQYGPCIGISRLKRWKRAETLGLNPPIEVLAVLMKEEEADKERKKDEEGRWKRAYIDELMEGRLGMAE